MYISRAASSQNITSNWFNSCYMMN